MTSSDVATLLKDHDSERLRDRRREPRKPFSRRILIATGPNRTNVHPAFSRDVSAKGMGTVGPAELQLNTIGWLTVYLLNKKSVTIEARVQWTESYGSWFLTGWSFTDY